MQPLFTPFFQKVTAVATIDIFFLAAAKFL